MFPGGAVDEADKFDRWQGLLNREMKIKPLFDGELSFRIAAIRCHCQQPINVAYHFSQLYIRCYLTKGVGGGRKYCSHSSTPSTPSSSRHHIGRMVSNLVCAAWSFPRHGGFTSVGAVGYPSS